MNMHGSPIFNFDRLQRGVFLFSNSNIIRRQPLQTHYILFARLHVLHYRDYPVCDYLRERERERERIY